jgi:uncharacterized protein (DUF302 family)
MTIGLSKTLPLSFDDAIPAVTEALKAEGFGVLTRVDVHDTLKQKLGVDFRRYVILGACNPSFAHRALSANLAAGLMMPCNVTLAALDDGKTLLQVVDPLQTMAPQLGKDFLGLAEEVRRKLDRVVGALPAA